MWQNGQIWLKFCFRFNPGLGGWRSLYCHAVAKIVRLLHQRNQCYLVLATFSQQVSQCYEISIIFEQTLRFGDMADRTGGHAVNFTDPLGDASVFANICSPAHLTSGDNSGNATAHVPVEILGLR